MGEYEWRPQKCTTVMIRGISENRVTLHWVIVTVSISANECNNERPLNFHLSPLHSQDATYSRGKRKTSIKGKGGE